MYSQLKTIEDSRKIRNRVLSNLEQASLPTTTPEERRTLLSFVVCGGGPTGVEFASELYDMINEDVLDYVSSQDSVEIPRQYANILAAAVPQANS